MAIVTKPYTFSSGAVIVAAEHNSNFDTIYNDHNGNIINANVSASAAIAYSKLNLASAIQTSDLAGAFYVPTGAMMPFGGTSAPTGWLLCDGSAVSRATYSALYTVIGTNYGSGDGSLTFNLPDRGGKVSVGYKSGDATFGTVGNTGGAKTVDASHTHSVPRDGWGSAGIDNTAGRLCTNADGQHVKPTGDNTSGSGGSATLSVLQPYGVDYWIIKT